MCAGTTFIDLLCIFNTSALCICVSEVWQVEYNIKKPSKDCATQMGFGSNNLTVFGWYNGYFYFF